MIHYEIINQSEQGIDTQAIEAGLIKAEETVGEDVNKFVSIEFVTAVESQKANKALRNKDEPTDIISLATQDTEAGKQEIKQTDDGALDFNIVRAKSSENQWPVLGQLIICFDIVAKNAQFAGQPVERELEWVVEHGVLHLLGYHHDHD